MSTDALPTFKIKALDTASTQALIDALKRRSHVLVIGYVPKNDQESIHTTYEGVPEDVEDVARIALKESLDLQFPRPPKEGGGA